MSRKTGMICLFIRLSAADGYENRLTVFDSLPIIAGDSGRERLLELMTDAGRVKLNAD
jgi:hypothetical protein